MKLSLAWIFDHIAGDWRNYDVQSIVNHFIRTTAEIESIEKISLQTDCLTADTVPHFRTIYW